MAVHQTNNFLVFDENQQNTMTTAAYRTDSNRVNGFTSGVARSDVFNKTLRQTSLITSAIGQILADKNYNFDDTASIETVINAIKAVFNIS